MKKYLIAVIAIFTLLLSQSVQAASRGINTVTVNGSSSTVVQIGDPVDVIVNATAGAGNGNKWGSTKLQVEGESVSCFDNTADHNNTTVSESFSVSAPSVAGTYNLSVWMYDGAGCVDSELGPEVLTDAIIVDEVVDNTPPALDLPADITEEATSASGAVVNFSVSATDETDPANPEVSCDYNSGDLFPLGLTTVNCSATDTANNEATGSFTITVEDTTGPEITVPGTVNDSTTGTSTPVSYVVTANDLVDGNVSVNCTPASGSGFAVGTTTVNCSATDSENNSSEAFFDVIVVYTETPDTVAPIITGTPAGASATTTGTSTVVTYTEPTAYDAVVGTTTVNCVPPSGSLFAVGTTTVTCTSNDGSNTATTTFDVVVTQVDQETPDTIPPVISEHSDVFATTTGTTTTVTYTSPTALDAVDGEVAVNCIPASGSEFSLGTTTVNCSASDTSNNTATSSFNVIITQVQGENNEEVVEEEEDNNSGGGSGGSNNSNNNSNDEEIDIVTVLALINAFGVSDAPAPAEGATTPTPTEGAEEVAGTEVGLTDESGATTTENTLPLAAAAATAEGSGFSWWWIVLLLVIAGIIWFLMRRRKNEGQ